MIDPEVKLKIDKAQTGLVMDSPFFATLALNKPWTIDNSPENETGWTDGTQYAYNEEWIKTLSLPQTVGFTAHEVLHNALLHNLRQGDREGDTWNEAADYEINPILLEAKFDLPDGHLDNPAFHGKFAEDIYEILIQRKGKQGKPGQGKPGNDPGKCGGTRPFPSPSGKPNPTPAEKAHQEQTQKIEVQAALTAAKRAGSLPGSLERLIDELLQPVIPWIEVLARFIDQHAANDYSMKRPSRRGMTLGLYLPSLYNEEIGRIGIFDDTSGSHFSAAQQKKALSEIQGILTSYQNVKATLLFIDTEVKGDPIELEADLEIDIPKPKGGGGTCFKPPFEYAEANGLEFKAAIYITDGQCNTFPDNPPDYDTLWLLTEENQDFNPPFGEVLTMPKE